MAKKQDTPVHFQNTPKHPITFACLPVHRHQEALGTRAKDLSEGIEADVRAAAVIDRTLVLVLAGVVVLAQMCAWNTPQVRTRWETSARRR